ncbi:alpha/beta fold hydrolase [Chelativorans sp. YIM 93263]|uniref:alpha/beta fold hydrolase n=1 Tax=Chelativorans sp. YIM 93263 TaxID=2906648 RepID=UPI002378EDE0|nr:alpha/beta hydrolase [Chelativorans sp. YIM 93263]
MSIRIRWYGWLAGLTIAAGAAVAVQIRSRKTERENPPAGKFIKVEGIRMHYVERGRGPAVVLLHGNSSLGADFLISELVLVAEEKYRLIVFDRPGYGYSDRPRGADRTPERQAHLIHAALRRIGVREAVVLGHSWGALVAMAMALNYPRFVRGLVLEAGFLYPQRRVDLTVLSLAAAPGLGALMRHSVLPLLVRAAWPLVAALLFAPAPVPQRFWRFPCWMVLRPSQMRASAAELWLTGSAASRLSRRYSELGVPLVILAGRGDHIVDHEAHSGRLHAELPHSEYRALDGVGHMIHHSNPQEVLDVIEAVLRHGR